MAVQTKLFRCDESSSYLELLGKDLEKCLYCDKATHHDHDIFGKIKFTPRQSRAFISFVLSDDKRSSGSVKDSIVGVDSNICGLVSLENSREENDPDMRELISHLKAGVIKASKEEETLQTSFKSKSVGALDVEIPPRNQDSLCCFSEDSPLTYSSIADHFSLRHGVSFRNAVLEEDSSDPPPLKPQCDICLGVFKDENSLQRHAALHTEDQERRFVCRICGKRFLKSSHLESHQLHHSGVKPFTCPSCPNKYSSEFALRNHVTHSHDIGIKPKCSDCGKTFFTSSSLRRHTLRFHIKDERLFCGQCPRIYLRKDNLQRHILASHGTMGKSKEEQYEIMVDGLFGEEGSRKGEALSGGLDASATEALLKNLTPQPDYLLKSLTPIPLEALEEMLLSTN